MGASVVNRNWYEMIFPEHHPAKQNQLLLNLLYFGANFVLQYIDQLVHGGRI